MDNSHNSDDFKDILSKLPFDKADINQNKLLLELISITIALRDKLKEKENYILTIQDTQIALDVLTTHINGTKYIGELTKYQKRLADQLIDATILFKLK